MDHGPSHKHHHASAPVPPFGRHAPLSMAHGPCSAPHPTPKTITLHCPPHLPRHPEVVLHGDLSQGGVVQPRDVVDGRSQQHAARHARVPRRDVAWGVRVCKCTAGGSTVKVRVPVCGDAVGISPLRSAGSAPLGGACPTFHGCFLPRRQDDAQIPWQLAHLPGREAGSLHPTPACAHRLHQPANKCTPSGSFPA